MSKDIHILELAAYEQPTITESKREDWVEFGDDNNYYQFLIDCYTNSTTQNAIINNTNRLVYGKGLSASDASRKPNEYAAMMALFSKKCTRHLVSDLKLLGQCAMQVIYSKDRKKIAQVEHIPVQLLRAEKCNEEGKVEAYYYSDDWTDIKNYKPQRIPAFGCSKEPIEIYFCKPYSVGLKYYSLVDYTGGLPYAVLEESISEYLINEVNNGFSSRSVINFNNGQPSDEQQRLIKNKVLNQLTGTQGEKVIVSFNNNAESKTTVDAMPVNDAPDLYATLSEECLRKIMLSHSVTSPLLFGIASSNGFSSNADELKDSFILFDNMVIRPMQELLIDAFDEILAYNGISLNLYFKTLKPLEFTDLSGMVDEEQIEEETGLELSEDTRPVLSDEAGELILDNLKGEIVTEEWEEVDELDSENTDLTDEEWAALCIKENKSLLTKLKDEIYSTNNGSAFSYLDSKNYKIRYRYAVGSRKALKEGNKSRLFCQNMMRLSNSGIVYRLEDIDRASREGVNMQLGHKGQPYDLFKYKGGVYCRHIWKKVLYRLKKNTEPSGDLLDYKRTRVIPKTYNKNPRGTTESVVAPVNMPNNGHHPNYKG
jgi:hypothetical protein|tara:strand:+ start:12350 stop:14140 length:1791 start_codon:yes stop_codon:yes gene_type:complete